ncbi:MAG: hypothetical protein ABGX20_11105 [Bacillus sp. (in: firmicutes)]
MTLDWKNDLINKTDITDYKNFKDKFNSDIVLILTDIQNYIKEHIQTHNISIDFIIYMIKQKPSLEILEAIKGILPLYSNYYQSIFCADLGIYLELIKDSSDIENKNNLLNFYTELEYLNTIENSNFKFIKYLIQFEQKKVKTTDDKIRFKKEIKEIIPKLTIQEIIAILPQLLEKDCYILVKTFLNKDDYKEIKNAIVQEVETQTEIGKVIKDSAPSYFDHEPKFDSLKFEQMTHYQIKNELEKINISSKVTELEDYLIKNEKSKIWEVIPFINQQNPLLTEKGIKKIWKKIKGKESFNDMLNLFSLAPSKLQEKALNKFIVEEHPEWKELLAKLLVRDKLLIKPYNVRHFIMEAIKDPKVQAELGKTSVDQQDPEIQSIVLNLLMQLKGNDFLTVIEYLDLIVFKLEEEQGKQLLDYILTNPIHEAERLIVFILERNPQILFERWTDLTTPLLERAIPEMVKIQPSFSKKLLSRVKTLTEYKEVRYRLQDAGVSNVNYEQTDMFGLIIRELNTMKYVTEKEKWEEFLEIIEEFQLTSLIWTNPIVWLQLNEQSNGHLFEAAVNVYGYEEACSYHLKLYEIIKLVNPPVAQDFLRVISFLSIKLNKRYSNGVIKLLNKDDLNQFFNIIMQEAAAYYDQYHVVQKEKDKFIERFAGIFSKKIEAIEMLISERITNDEHSDLLRTLKHYFNELWTALEELSLSTVEEVNHLGEEVTFDSKKHEGTAISFNDGDKVVVKTLGLKLGEKVKRLSKVSIT